MRITRTKIAAVLGAAAIATLMLSGCSAGQSKADACKQMESKLSSVASDLQSNLGDLQSDPSKAASAIDNLSSKFSSAADGVTQPDVKKAADKAGQALNTFSHQIASYAKDPKSADTSAITSSSSKLSSSFTALQKVCTGK